MEEKKALFNMLADNSLTEYVYDCTEEYLSICNKARVALENAALERLHNDMVGADFFYGLYRFHLKAAIRFWTV